MTLAEARARGHNLSEKEKDEIVAMVDKVMAEVQRMAGVPAKVEPNDLWLPPQEAELIRRSK